MGRGGGYKTGRGGGGSYKTGGERGGGGGGQVKLYPYEDRVGGVSHAECVCMGGGGGGERICQHCIKGLGGAKSFKPAISLLMYTPKCFNGRTVHTRN